MIINEATREYVRQHQDDDVKKLALQGTKNSSVDLPMALQQIAGRQTARRKLPAWAEVEDVIYPPHLNMEQCSSEQTARYKQQLVERLMAADGKGTYADLTGGFGVDFYWMSQGFSRRVYVEQNAELCAVAEHNFALLSLPCTIHCCDAATFLSGMESPADIIYLDPARRNEHGGRTYGIADCTPNVLELLPQLLEKARFIVLKLSPMLDWRKAVSDLQEAAADCRQSHAIVSEVHIVSVSNECKELLLVLSRQGQTEHPTVVCVNDRQVFQVGATPLASAATLCHEAGPLSAQSFLYEPNSSIMKAGCFAEVERQYPVRQLSANSHLFVSSVEIVDFPGRRFQISAISSMNKQELREVLAGMERANITVRNFPLTPEQLRKKLKLKDGGDVYIFATTLPDGEHKLLLCRKI